jgi:hypothetical protein
MIHAVFPDWQFTRLSEAEINAALKDPNPGNHIAIEVARLVEAYTANFLSRLDGLGVLPHGFLQASPQTAIEAVAMRLTASSIQESIAAFPYTHPLAA